MSYGKQGYWKNKQGHDILIANMPDSYINNVLNYINDRICEAYNSYYDTDFEVPDPLQDKIDELETELQKRKLNKKRPRSWQDKSPVIK